MELLRTVAVASCSAWQTFSVDWVLDANDRALMITLLVGSFWCGDYNIAVVKSVTTTACDDAGDRDNDDK